MTEARSNWVFLKDTRSCNGYIPLSALFRATEAEAHYELGKLAAIHERVIMAKVIAET